MVPNDELVGFDSSTITVSSSSSNASSTPASVMFSVVDPALIVKVPSAKV